MRTWAAIAMAGCVAALAVNLAAAELAPAEVKAGATSVSVSFGPGQLDLPEAAALEWIERAAASVTAYYGKFPIETMRVKVFPAEGRSGVFHGTTYGHSGGFTRISVGQHTTREELNDDWMMTHEFIHLAFPDVPEDNHWIEEGISTYVEPVARAQAGFLPAAKVWGEMVRYMPRGEPEEGDQGLDNTHTWGRTYWGGAMFCLLADVRIRQCSGNRKGLQDALRAILKAGGTIEHEWPVKKAFETGDRATGCTALSDLYREMKDRPVNVDLDDLWKKLGIRKQGRDVTFDDNAPLAAIRLAITAGRRSDRF
jgi:hypothetical protein